MLLKRALRAAAIACGMALSTAAFAQAWPAKPIATVSRGLVGALEDKSVQDAIRNIGYEPVPNTPTQFAAVIRNDLEKWRKVVHEAKIRVD